MTTTTRIDFTLPDPIEPDEDTPQSCDHCGEWADYFADWINYIGYGRSVGRGVKLYWNSEHEALCSRCHAADLVWAAHN